MAGQHEPSRRHLTAATGSLRAQSLPPVGRLAFQAIFQPIDFVSGDLYDLQRFDNGRVGLTLVDAAGHSIPAALLTVHLRRVWREGPGRTVHTPAEVLAALNADLVAAARDDCRFVAACYALFDATTGEVQLARAGTPYAILRRAEGRTQLLGPGGPLLGVVPEAPYEVLSDELREGDALLLYTDGLEALVGAGEGATSGRRPDEEIRDTRWFTTLEREGLDAALAELAALYERRSAAGEVADDLTLLTVRASG